MSPHRGQESMQLQARAVDRQKIIFGDHELHADMPLVVTRLSQHCHMLFTTLLQHCKQWCHK